MHPQIVVIVLVDAERETVGAEGTEIGEIESGTIWPLILISKSVTLTRTHQRRVARMASKAVTSFGMASSGCLVNVR